MKIKIALVVAMVLISALSGSPQRREPVRQEPPVPTGPPVNSAPNPYRAVPGWYQWPQGRAKGSIPAVAVGKNDDIWAIERCGIIGFRDTTSAAEGIAIDSKGAIYGAEVVPNDLKKYVRK